MEMVSERFSDVMWLFNQYVFSNAASRLAGAIRGTYGDWRERRNFLLLTMYLQEIWESGKRSRHKTAQAVSDRRYVRLSRGYIEVLDAKALKKI